MRGSLRSLWLNLRASYWFIPTLLTLLAALLAFVTMALDHAWGAAWLASYQWFDPAGPEGARAQLTVIASAMIAVASTVFAITIAAVAYASGNYGPRVLTNFMNDRGNQLSLGVFIATFVYNLLVLRAVRNQQEAPPTVESGLEAAAAFVPQLSMIVSGLSAIIAVAVLVYFLHHIPASIRIDSLLGGIGRKLIRDIERRFPEAGGAEEPVERIEGAPVAARRVGYVEIIDFAELDRIARKEGVRLALRVRTGDFIHPRLPVLEVAGAEPTDALQGRLLDCLSIGESRTPTQDLEFLIDELVEIALRALSPGINDPFTAVTSMHWMGAALARLADRNLRNGPEQPSYDSGRVQPVADGFGHFVRRSFGSLRASAATNVIAAKIFIEVLHGASLGAASPDRKAELIDEARRLVEEAEAALTSVSLAEVRRRLQRFEEAARSARHPS